MKEKADFESGEQCACGSALRKHQDTSLSVTAATVLPRKHKAQAGMGGASLHPSSSGASSRQTWAFAKEFGGWAGLSGISRGVSELGVELSHKGLWGRKVQGMPVMLPHRKR